MLGAGYLHKHAVYRGDRGTRPAGKQRDQ